MLTDRPRFPLLLVFLMIGFFGMIMIRPAGAEAIASGDVTQRLLALTMDDLPSVGPQSRPAKENLKCIVEALVREKVPATGFVVGNRGGYEALKIWADAGLSLGNHTWSHPAYSRMAIPDYLDELKRTSQVSADRLGIDLRKGFFRYPFLDHGNSEEKVAAVEQYLRETGGRLAHVSLDTVDYRFAVEYGKPGRKMAVREYYLQHLADCAEHFERLSQRLYGRRIPLILLLHANELNADTMSDVLAGFRKLGYRFISLEQAVADAAYQPWLYRPPLVKCKGDRNFLNQVALSRGIDIEDISGDAYFKKSWVPRLKE